MLTELALKYGSAEDQRLLKLNVTEPTVFVGPNNSGKSLVLRETEHYIKSGGQGDFSIVEKVKAALPELALARQMLKTRVFTERDGRHRLRRLTPSKEGRDILRVSPSAVQKRLDRTEADTFLLESFVYLFSLRLDGTTRLRLTSPEESHDLFEPPQNHLVALFQNDSARQQLRELTKEAFGLHFVIDPTAMRQLRVRMSPSPPEDTSQEQALDGRARKFHQAAHDIQDLSDGVRAYVGVLASILSGDFRTILMDEPEAFLHPPLAALLGRRTVEQARDNNGNVIASTHSPSFLMGCVQSGRPVNVVRLTYRDGVSGARLLPSDELSQLMRNPLLRSSGTLQALFHDGAVVTESDTDRVFYHEINERLAEHCGKGSRNVLFLNAQNKQTVGSIIDPLRRMGIPAAAIVDLDILKGSHDLKELMKAAQLPTELRQSYGQLRGTIQATLDDAGVDAKRHGMRGMPNEVRQSTAQLIEGLGKYGVFPVPVGELENWLAQLNVHSGHGPAWLVSIFDAMGSDPAGTNFLKPDSDDVWEFVERIMKWVGDPHRLGVLPASEEGEKADA